MPLVLEKIYFISIAMSVTYSQAAHIHKKATEKDNDRANMVKH